uniref:Uncharacterized protein n=1 Tax=Siphoviridae sp. ctv4j104 TaxID=2826510 RepID=A0A8S5M9X7_9CAUD|nr:MAG TPA: hypothetical protein [Siphoviridae sp. ctv4j104]
MERVKDGYLVTEDEIVEMMMSVMDRIERLDKQRQYADDRFHDYWEEEYQKCDAIYTAFYGHNYRESQRDEQDT